MFFTSVFAGFHEAINEAFDDVGVSFPEAFVGVTAEGMEHEGGLNGDIALKARIGDRAFFGRPFIEEEEVFRVVRQGTHQITRGEAL